MTEEEQQWLEMAAFGKQVEQFWGSRLGIYLQNRAQDCYNAAISELKIADPTDAQKIMKLQNEVKLAERFTGWLSEAVRDGLHAIDVLEGEDENVVQ